MMDLGDLLEICRKYNDLGWAVQAQLREVADDPDKGDFNPNALEMMQDFLKEAMQFDVEGAEATLESMVALLAADGEEEDEDEPG